MAKSAGVLTAKNDQTTATKLEHSIQTIENVILCFNFIPSSTCLPTFPSRCFFSGCGLSFCCDGVLPRCVGAAGLHHGLWEPGFSSITSITSISSISACAGVEPRFRHWSSQDLQAAHCCSGMSNYQKHTQARMYTHTRTHSHTHTDFLHILYYSDNCNLIKIQLWGS